MVGILTVIFASLLFDSLVECSATRLKRSHHFGHKSLQKRQANKLVPKWTPPILYTIDVQFPNYTRDAILKAIGWLQTQTCVKFQLVVTPPLFTPFIQFIHSPLGCTSSVGSIGVNSIFLQPEACSIPGVIAHEVLHALGFVHEHQRADSPEHISVELNYIKPMHQSNYMPLPSDAIERFNTPYDFGSVMHYPSFTPSYALAEKENLPVLIASDSAYQMTMGQRVELSFLDVYRVNQHYCADVCKGPNNCTNGGYPDPHNCAVCQCPTGLGSFHKCAKVAKSLDNCGGELVANSNWTAVALPANKVARKCHWLIRGPNGTKVVLKFGGKFALPCYKDQHVCQNSYLEVKVGDFRATGGRQCCSTANSTQLFHSVSDRLLVIYKNANTKQKTNPKLLYKMA